MREALAPGSEHFQGGSGAVKSTPRKLPSLRSSRIAVALILVGPDRCRSLAGRAHA
jgi:hypothetical protein